MVKLEFNRVVAAALIILTLSAISGLAAILWQGSRTQHLTLAAGAASGESYILAGALKQVVERHYPRIRITLLETGGTVENLRFLEEGRAQLATAQADVLAGPECRIIAVLYDETFQLMVPRDSRLQNFTDLRGKSIALAPSGGQFQSFLRVAEHFGLHATDFRFIGATDAAADEAFLQGRADAAFRVRTLGNPAIQRLLQSGQVQFLPIEHAAAMKIKYPAFEPSVIPQGAYLGNPPVPAQNLPTVAVNRALVASEAANETAVRSITQILMERRAEIMQEIPERMTEVRSLLGRVRRPSAERGLGPPAHPGATSFYDKDKPSFLQANADFVGLILTAVVMIGSWIWEIKRWMQKKQKTAADQHSNRVVALMGSAQEANAVARLDDIWRELLGILTQAVYDLDADKLSEESFASFRSILSIGLDVTKERRAILVAAHTSAEAVSQ
jgi:TRAP transporter TAXI family solute receptor